MLLSNVLLPSVLLPLAVAATVLVALTRLSGTVRAASGWALAAAFATTFLALTGPPRIPPVEATQRLLLLVAAAPLVTDLAAMGRRVVVVRTLQALLLAGTIFWLVQTLVVNSWSTTESALRLTAMLGLAALVLFGVRSALTSTSSGDEDESDTAPSWLDRPIVARLLLLVLLGATTAALGLAGSARLSFLLLGATTGFVAVEVFQLVAQRTGRTSSGGPWRDGHELVLATIVVGLLVVGHHYAELTLLQALLFAGAYGLLLLPGRLRALAVLPALVVIGLLAYAFLTREEDPYDYYSGLPETILGSSGDDTRVFRRRYSGLPETTYSASESLDLALTSLRSASSSDSRTAKRFSNPTPRGS